jgi:ubiquinone/menaquinone biosynthesis C-methylase UbiE
MSILDHTERTRRRYDRLAPFYDLFGVPMERGRLSVWRRRLLERIKGPLALEVGIGTGKNMPFYPPGVKVTGIDLSPQMIERAKRRGSSLGLHMDLRIMDAQKLDFPDNHFDTVFATFVFCSVPDPVSGLMEMRRVCKPSGRLLLLEHMQSRHRGLAWLLEMLNPLIVRFMGANINRNTMENIRKAGWEVDLEQCLWLDIVRWVEARPLY